MVVARRRIDGDGQSNGQEVTLGPVEQGMSVGLSAPSRWDPTKCSRCLRAVPGHVFRATSTAVGLGLAGFLRRRGHIRFLRVCRTTNGLRFLALGINPQQHGSQRGCVRCTDEERLSYGAH